MARISRRDLIIGAPAVLGAGGLPLSAALAQESAADYPSREVKFVCAFPAGSGADVYVRYFAERMRPAFKRTIIVENRAGANGNIASTYVARSKPDGYTIYVHAPSSVAANMHLFKNPPIDAAKEIVVAATINRQPFMLTVHASSPVKTVPELVELLKKKGDKASYGTTAPTSKVAGAWFNKVFGLNPVEIAYKTGGDSMNDMQSGAIDYVMHDPVHAVGNVANGSLRMLGVTTKERMKSLPDLPSLHELGVTDLDVPGWWAAMVPAGTPQAIVEKLNQMWKPVIDGEETRAFMAKFGADTMSLSTAEAKAMFEKDIKAWGEYIKLANIEQQG